MKRNTLTSVEKKNGIVAAADDKKANYITEIDLRGKTIIADFFIICTGTSNIHIRAVADGIIEGMEKQGVRQNRIEGYNEANWVLLDYGDVIVHIMSEDQRHYYKLEALWAGQPTPGRHEDAEELDEREDEDTDEDEREDEDTDEDEREDEDEDEREDEDEDEREDEDEDEREDEDEDGREDDEEEDEDTDEDEDEDEEGN